MLKDLIRKNRSYRRFYEDYTISQKTLKELVELARLSASAANSQPLKFILSYDTEKNRKIFSQLSWAGYLEDWPGPKQGEKPSAYIIILGDKKIKESFGCDHGIAAQSILLGAIEKGLGGCMIGSIEKDTLREKLNIPECYEILLIIALGKPKEEVVIDDVGEKGDIKYWRDENGVHHVPKRTLEELILDI
jgi:nitroreductase